MPTYNPDLGLIKRAITSIINQTYEEWNLYIINDGGQTDLSDVIKEFNDKRINFYAMPHKGKAATLNFALSKSAGKYLAYLDDDDVWYPNHLEVVISYMERNNARFVHTDAHEVFVKRKGDLLKEVSRRNLNRGVVTDKTMWYISHINAVHERSLLDDAGVYDEERKFFIDWDMFQRFAKHTKPHHLKIFTCEHYIYLDRQRNKANIISGIHGSDPELSKKAHQEMFLRSFELLSAEDFVEFIQEWEDKDQTLEMIFSSLSWRITKPIRWIYNKLKD